MKRFVFREARLLALRKQEVTLAELGVAKASQQVRAAAANVEANVATLDELGDHVAGNRTDGLTVMDQIALGIRTRLEQARHELASRETELAQALEALKHARVAMESLDTLKRVRQAEHREEANRASQHELDAMGVRYWADGGEE